MISLWRNPPPVFRFPSPAQWDPTRNRWWVRTILFGVDVMLHAVLVVSLGFKPAPRKPPPPPRVVILVFPKPPPPPPPAEKQPEPPKTKQDQPAPGPPVIPPPAQAPTPTTREQRKKAGYQIDGTDEELVSVLEQIDGWIAFNIYGPGQRVVFRYKAPDWEKAPDDGQAMLRTALSVERSSAIIEGLRARAGLSSDAPVNILVTGEYYNRLWVAIDAKKPAGMTGVGYSHLRLFPGAQIQGNPLGVEVLSVQPISPDPTQQ